jgi:hypothetical protein
MTPETFWTSQDGQILSLKIKKDVVALTLAFWPRHPQEFEFLKAHLAELRFTERSSLARIGIEMILRGTPELDGNRVTLRAEAFLYDGSFPNAAYWQKLLRPGTPVGRLFYAPAAAKLSSTEIWAAIQANALKLPETISIDSSGRVFFTPHAVSYTLNPRLQKINFEHIVSGYAGRSFIDKVQVRHDASPLTIPPRSGILTSCSMYLKEHYVVLNPGEGNFGLHTSAILLDPVKTFGTNIMLEVYNTGEHPVVNPMVSVEIFRAPPPTDPELKTLTRASGSSARPKACSSASTNPPRATPARPRPRPASPSAARAQRWKTARSSSAPTTTSCASSFKARPAPSAATP